jgi:hypothetical protein
VIIYKNILGGIKMKKTVLLIMILSLVFVIVACTGGDKDEDPTPTATPTPEVTQEPTEEPDPTEEPTPAPTRQPDPEVDGIIFHFFYDYDYGHEVLQDTQQVDTEWVEGKGLAISPVSDDPWVMITAIGPNDEEVNIMEYPVLKMRVLNQTPSNLFEAFVGRTTIITGDDLFQSTIEPNGTDFVDIIIDLAALKGEDFLAVNNGTLACVRLDIVNLTPWKDQIEEKAGDGTYMIYLDYFGFFKTVEDAQNWVPSHLSE